MECHTTQWNAIGNRRKPLEACRSGQAEEILPSRGKRNRRRPRARGVEADRSKRDRRQPAPRDYLGASWEQGLAGATELGAGPGRRTGRDRSDHTKSAPIQGRRSVGQAKSAPTQGKGLVGASRGRSKQSTTMPTQGQGAGRGKRTRCQPGAKG